MTSLPTSKHMDTSLVDLGLTWKQLGRPKERLQERRILYYCHDTYGLGHLRRTLTVAGYLRDQRRSLSQLVVTGSPVAQSFPLPESADIVKLPSVVKVGPERYESRSVTAPFNHILGMRRDIVLSAARHFRPHVMVVDHAPAGLKGEVVETLRYLKRESLGTKLVVGLRDVLDEPEKVRRSWAREGVYELLDEVYDLILVYGRRDIYDVVEEYGLSRTAAAKTRYVGYLRREAGKRSAEQVRCELNVRTDRLVVVTAGGGEDGSALFKVALEALRRRRSVDFDCLLVCGPLMPADERDRLLEAADPEIGVHVLDFAPDMASYLGAADAVVSMGGYNTVCEILSLRRPATIVPRVSPRKEQLIRAEALSRHRFVRVLHPAELGPDRLMEEMYHLLEGESRAPNMALDGLPQIRAELKDLLGEQQEPSFGLVPHSEGVTLGAHGREA